MRINKPGMRKKHAAVSELVSAMAIIGVAAVIAGILFVTLSEENQDTREVVLERTDLSKMKASELIAVSNKVHEFQKRAFVLHNYAEDTDLARGNFDIYILDSGGGIRQGSAGGLNLGHTGGTGNIIPRTSFGTAEYSPIGCAETLVLVTPAKELITVEPAEECITTCPIGYQQVGNSCQRITCPAGQVLVGSTCMDSCTANSTRDTTNVCVCNSGYEMVGTSCLEVCTDPNQVRNPGTNICECRSGYEIIGGVCTPVCTPNSTRQADGTCQCNSGYAEIGGTCVSGCPLNSSRQGNSCNCDLGYERVGASCVPLCGLNEERARDGTCQCISNPQYVRVGGVCVAPCTGDQVRCLLDNSCRNNCTERNTTFNPNSCSCMCSTGFALHPDGRCVDPRDCPAYSSPVSTPTGPVCTCNSDRELSGNSCACKPNSSVPSDSRDGVCQCNTGYERIGADCLANCPANSVRNSTTNVCECNSGYEMVNNTCMAECGSNETRNSTTNVCECSPGYVRQGSTCVRSAPPPPPPPECNGNGTYHPVYGCQCFSGYEKSCGSCYPACEPERTRSGCGGCTCDFDTRVYCRNCPLDAACRSSGKSCTFNCEG